MYVNLARSVPKYGQVRATIKDMIKTSETLICNKKNTGVIEFHFGNASHHLFEHYSASVNGQDEFATPHFMWRKRCEINHVLINESGEPNA